MATDRCYTQKFNCIKCDKQSKDTVWESKFYEQHCVDCDSLLEPIFDIVNETPHIGGKFKKGRSLKERNARRSNDFKVNVLPTIGGADKKHFEKKLGKLGQKYK